MDKANLRWRSKASRSAIASVRAEGVSPSKKTVSRMRAYASGKISASELRDSVRYKADPKPPRG